MLGGCSAEMFLLYFSLYHVLVIWHDTLLLYHMSVCFSGYH